VSPLITRMIMMNIIRQRKIKKAIAAGAVVFGLLAINAQPLYAQATHTSQDWAQTVALPGQGDTLRNYLARLRAALLKAKENPDLQKPLKLSAKVTAEGRTGIRRLRIRNFQFLSDGSKGSAESNLGAGSWPTVVGVLGSAVAQDFLFQAALKNIPIDGLEVVFTSIPASAASSGGGRVTYPQNLNYTAYIDSPATDAQLDELRQTVERESAVLNLVSKSQEIDHGTLTYTQTPAERDPAVTLEGLREFLADKRRASQGAVPFGSPPRAARGGQNRGQGATPDSSTPAAGAPATATPIAAAGGEAGTPASPPDARPRRNQGEPPLRAHIKVEGGSGIRHIRTDASNFQIIHDSPRYLAGHNLGPVAEEHILGVMITCLTHIYEIQAANRQVPIDVLELEVEGTLSSHIGASGTPPRYSGISYKVHIGSPASKETIDELQKAVEAACPIYNMLKNSQEIKGSIVRGGYKEPVRTAAVD